MIHDIFMPALSSTMTEGKIVEWVKSPGEKVEKGETVVVVESDKADMDVESFNSGYLAVILVEAGQEAPVGNAIAYIAETEAEIAEAKKRAASSKGSSAIPPSAPKPATVATPVAATATITATSNGNNRTVASPRAKKLAKEFGVDLKTLQGSGPYGRIVAIDVEQAAGKSSTKKVATPVATTIAAPTPAPVTAQAPAPVRVTTGETVPLNTLQKAVVQNMVASLQVPT